jgi:hypothetical protein
MQLPIILREFSPAGCPVLTSWYNYIVIRGPIIAMRYNTDDKLGPVFIYLDRSTRNELLIYKTILKPICPYEYNAGVRLPLPT